MPLCWTSANTSFCPIERWLCATLVICWALLGPSWCTDCRILFGLDPFACMFRNKQWPSRQTSSAPIRVGKSPKRERFEQIELVQWIRHRKLPETIEVLGRNGWNLWQLVINRLARWRVNRTSVSLNWKVIEKIDTERLNCDLLHCRWLACWDRWG